MPGSHRSRDGGKRSPGNLAVYVFGDRNVFFLFQTQGLVSGRVWNENQVKAPVKRQRDANFASRCSFYAVIIKTTQAGLENKTDAKGNHMVSIAAGILNFIDGKLIKEPFIPVFRHDICAVINK